MKEGKQKIFDTPKTCPQKNRTASEGYVGGQTFIGITENNAFSKDQPAYGMLEYILSPTNLNKAYLQVRRNKGSGGTDKMEVGSLKDYLVRHKEVLIQSILMGKYRPNPVRRVFIPKENGSKRQLGIPTVVDRVIQQSIYQLLSPVYEPQFSRTVTGSDRKGMPTMRCTSAGSISPTATDTLLTLTWKSSSTQ